MADDLDSIAAPGGSDDLLPATRAWREAHKPTLLDRLDDRFTVMLSGRRAGRVTQRISEVVFATPSPEPQAPLYDQDADGTLPVPRVLTPDDRDAYAFWARDHTDLRDFSDVLAMPELPIEGEDEIAPDGRIAD